MTHMAFTGLIEKKLEPLPLFLKETPTGSFDLI